MLSTELIPAPGDADAVTVEVVGAGEVRLNPEGNVHVPSQPANRAGRRRSAIDSQRVSSAVTGIKGTDKKMVDVLL